ncbi:MAG: heme NO-binding domain-containing protein [Shimia sp.]
MHGLVNRALQCFVRDTYGDEVWSQLMEAADLGYVSFESMLIYEDAVTFRVLDLASGRLQKARAELLEDLGTYLVSHHNVEALRRLLRFGGADFTEFLHSLDDLPDRARLAVPDLDLPPLELIEEGEGRYILRCGTALEGYGHVMMGVLRTLADDYGALAFLEHNGTCGAFDCLGITLVDVEFTEGRSFALAREAS